MMRKIQKLIFCHITYIYIILVQEVADFVKLRDQLINLIYSENVYFKSSTNCLKIETKKKNRFIPGNNTLSKKKKYTQHYTYI